jgi:hypothetical protein
MVKRLLGVAALLLADTALAHPGHGVAPAASWLHSLELAHLAPALLAAAAASLLVAALRKRSAVVRERRR